MYVSIGGERESSQMIGRVIIILDIPGDPQEISRE